MRNNDQSRTSSPRPSRRQLFEILGAAAATAGAIPAMTRPALAQDNPTDCAPPGIAGKTPVPFKPEPTLPVRVRKSAFELSTAEIDRLKTAYAALRKLNTDHPDDPRGWLSQGHVHCWYCGGGSNGQEGESIHGSWWFFPWHRAYLYFHERILCKLIGDDTLALPYWDWDSDKRQMFPASYGDPSDNSNPLFDMLRSAAPHNPISTGAVSVRGMNLTMNSSTNNLYMGTQTGRAGAMERQPHGPVHIWTGDTSMQSIKNDMGVLATAAQDPVFFAHHANIDRLWTVWLNLAPATHQNFPSPTWSTHAWQFYDENAVWTEIAVSDVLDPSGSLRYTWQAPSVKPIWTFTPKAPKVAITAALGAAPTTFLVANAPGGIAIGTKPQSRTVSLPPPLATGLTTLSVTSPSEYLLHIEDIQVPPDQQVMFQVFINLPDANAKTSVDLPNFAGTVTVLAQGVMPVGHRHASVNEVLDITDTLSQVAKESGGKLSVTLVPAAGDAEPTKDSGATFKRIYIEKV
jgi:polyphenol oxidase